MSFLIRRKIETERYTWVERLLPLFCAAVTYKTIFNYYVFLAPGLTTLWTLAYTAVTLVMMLLFVFLACKALVNWNCYMELRPTLLIPICVVLNILVVIAQTGDASILSRSYRMMLAVGTNDEFGYYFSQINVWFGNMAVVMLLTFYARHRDTLIKCIISCMTVIIIPAVLIMLIHPEYLGVRQSTFEESDVVFGGGLWNIGVMSFGSFAWPAMLLFGDMKKGQKWLTGIATALFLFFGVAGVSRTLILMAVFSVSFYILDSRKDATWLMKSIVIFFALVAFLTLEGDLMDNIVSRFLQEDTFSENIRFALWEEYLSHYKEYWLFGAPLGNVYNYYHKVNIIGHYYLPHSAPINFFVRFGLLSALAYLALIRNAFLKNNAALSPSATVCMKAGCIAYITLAFINQTGYADAIFYIMFGLLLAYRRVVDYERARG